MCACVYAYVVCLVCVFVRRRATFNIAIRQSGVTRAAQRSRYAGLSRRSRACRSKDTPLTNIRLSLSRVSQREGDNTDVKKETFFDVRINVDKRNRKFYGGAAVWNVRRRLLQVVRRGCKRRIFMSGDAASRSRATEMCAVRK